MEHQNVQGGGVQITLSENPAKFALIWPPMRDLNVLKRLTMSWRVAEHRKYSCFKRSSFPSMFCM